MRDEFARLRYALHCAVGDDATTTAFKGAFGFVKCVLAQPKTNVAEKRRRESQSTTALVLERLRRWCNGECVAL